MGLAAIVVLCGCASPVASGPAVAIDVVPPRASSPVPEPASAATGASSSDLSVVARTPKPGIFVILPDPSSAATAEEAAILRAAHEAEAAFDLAHTREDLELVRARYRRALALAGPSHSISGVLRFKLAWAHHRADDFPAAFEAFWALMDDPLASDFRDEVREYLAILIVEPSWRGGAAPDPLTGYDRPEIAARIAGREPWIHEVVAQAAEIYDQDGARGSAVRGFELAAARAPDAERQRHYQSQAAAAGATP